MYIIEVVAQNEHVFMRKFDFYNEMIQFLQTSPEVWNRIREIDPEENSYIKIYYL